MHLRPQSPDGDQDDIIDSRLARRGLCRMPGVDGISQPQFRRCGGLHVVVLVCMAPVAVPGLCPTCGTTVAAGERAAWVGRRAGLLILVSVLLGLWAS